MLDVRVCATALILVTTSPGAANSVEFIPLKKAPSSKAVIGVANGNQFWSENENHPWLTKEQIRLFLDQGRLVNDYQTILKHPAPSKGAEGVFFTKAAGIYEWQLLSPQVLRIFRFDDGHQETAILVLPGDTAITPGTAAAPPFEKLSEVFRQVTIAAFSNGGPASTGFRLRVERSRVSRFFEKGTAFIGDRPAALQLWNDGWVTVPGERLRRWTEDIDPASLKNMARMDSSQLRPTCLLTAIDGVVLLSNGWVVWWTLWDDAALKLRDSWGREQVLVLPPLAK